MPKYKIILETKDGNKINPDLSDLSIELDLKSVDMITAVQKAEYLMDAIFHEYNARFKCEHAGCIEKD